MTAPTVEPAGVSELDGLWRAYQLGQVSLDHTARQVFCEVLAPLINERNSLHQQLAELQQDMKDADDNYDMLLAKNIELKQQLAEMRGGNSTVIRKEVLRCLLEHAIDGKALALCEPENTYIREAYAALAPTSQPSRGKPDELCDHCGEHANEHGAIGHQYIAPRKCDAYIPGHNSSRCVLISGHRGDCSDTSPDCAQPSQSTCADPVEACRMFCAWKGGGPCLAEDCPRRDCAQPERQGAEDDDGADTGNAEADRVLRRLASSDPDFEDCTAAAVLIRRLVADMRGPDGFATWKDAAIAERMKRPSPPQDDIESAMDDLVYAVERNTLNRDEYTRAEVADARRHIASLGEKGCTREAVIRECWDAINKYIKSGTLPGNGCDESAQRNGMILASNVLMDMMVKS